MTLLLFLCLMPFFFLKKERNDPFTFLMFNAFFPPSAFPPVAAAAAVLQPGHVVVA